MCVTEDPRRQNYCRSSIDAANDAEPPCRQQTDHRESNTEESRSRKPVRVRPVKKYRTEGKTDIDEVLSGRQIEIGMPVRRSGGRIFQEVPPLGNPIAREGLTPADFGQVIEPLPHFIGHPEVSGLINDKAIVVPRPGNSE